MVSDRTTLCLLSATATTNTSMGCAVSSLRCAAHREAIFTALLFVSGINLYAAAFHTGGPGAGYLLFCILPFIMGTVAVRCLVLRQAQHSYHLSGHDSNPKWSLFWIGACATIIMLLPVTLYRMGLIDPLAYLFTTLGTEVQFMAIAMSAYGTALGMGGEDFDGTF